MKIEDMENYISSLADNGIDYPELPGRDILKLLVVAKAAKNFVYWPHGSYGDINRPDFELRRAIEDLERE